jgi:tetraacyldisaccharide 4'-kinase
MEAWFSREWQRNGAWQLVLRPISWMFLLLVAMRRAAYRAGLLKSSDAGVPVIIVGNISVGGTGKTPMVLALTEALAANGKRCGIVTRGYQLHKDRSETSVVRVLPGESGVKNAGDEAALLARRSCAPVYAGADRVCAAQMLLRNHAEVDVIISDDGMQHYALQRAVEICVIDGGRAFGNGALLPAGPLREPVSRLATVDAIVINRTAGCGPSRADTLRFPAVVPVFDMTLGNETFINLRTQRSLNCNDALIAFQGLRIHALAGTGHPQRFFSHLSSVGMKLGSTQSFPDHHHYLAGDLKATGAAIVLMTEKDAVKCESIADERMWFMRVDAILPKALADFVLKKLSDRKE